ncbi:MAG TPA: amino acid permease [Candidatus Solibacter sp.]|jgi:AAT family amino acid transporter|nr:amino acid permease [Candidatus Solibacter sp.]
MIQQQTEQVTDREQGLKRQLTAGQMAMVAVGGSIGTGLLLGSGTAIKNAGPAVIVSYVISALICWTVALAMGEMSSMHPAAGSFGVYAELYLNDWAGFVARYSYWFSVVIAIGSEVVAAGTYMQVWFPKVPVVTWMIVFGLLLLLVNFFPVGNYGTFEYWFAFIKVLTIFLFIVIGAALLAGAKVHPQYVANGGFAPNGWKAAFLAVSFGLYSFLGIEMVAISSGEARSGAEVSKATRISFAMLVFLYVGAMAVLVGVMPWRNAGGGQSPFVTVFNVAGISSAGTIMNLVVLSAALSGANASLYVTSRMLFSLARSGHAPRRLGVVNSHGVPMPALMASMVGIVIAIFVQEYAPEKAYLYIIGAALFGGMLAWLISLAAHVRFRKVISHEQLAGLKLRAPLGSAGSILGLIAIIAAIVATWWVPDTRVTVVSAGPYLLILTVAYFLVRKRA